MANFWQSASASTIWTAIGIFVLGFLVDFSVKLYHHRRAVRGLPMPPHSFLLGNLVALGKLAAKFPLDCHPHIYMTWLKKEYDLPDVFFFDTWPVGNQTCAIVDPVVANYVTVQHSLPKHPIIAEAVGPVTGYNSLVSINGARHKLWRSAFSSGFSNSHIMKFVPGIVDDGLVFASLLEKHANDQDIIELEDMTTKLTMDIIARVVLDSEWQSQTKYNKFVAAFGKQMQWLPGDASLNPFTEYNFIRHAMNWYYTRIMDKYLMDIMNARFAKRTGEEQQQAKGQQSRPIIDLALDAYLSAEGSGGKTINSQIFKTGALDQIKVFMFAGHDTTSSTICYAVYALWKHPELMVKIRQEYVMVFGDDMSRIPHMIKENPQLINRLPYTVAVIKEALRLWPAASSVRIGDANTIIHHDGNQYPTKGFMVWPIAHALQHSPSLWHDPYIFNPERWLVGPGDPLFPVKGAWRAFEHGPRNCIGQELAMIEARIILVLMLSKFDFTPAYDEIDAKDPAVQSGRKVVRTPDGERAYQIRIGTAKPANRMPGRVKRAQTS